MAGIEQVVDERWNEYLQDVQDNIEWFQKSVDKSNLTKEQKRKMRKIARSLGDLGRIRR